MLAYRVFWYDPTASDDTVAGHPTYLHRPQGTGRLDNPSEYDVWYLADSPSAAVGEVFGDLAVWEDDMFIIPSLPNGLRSLATVSVADSSDLLDLDDARNLLDRGLRPTQVIERRRSVSQSWALDIFRETTGNQRKWAGVRWWSFQRPHWRVFGLWVDPGQPAPFDVKDVDILSVRHQAVIDAANSLGRATR